MQGIGAVTALILGSVALLVAGLGIYQGKIWCVPRHGLEWKGRWVRRSRESVTFWCNAVGIGLFGLIAVVVALKFLIAAG